MDHLIYTAANGASRTMEQQAAIANNLANVNTTGFRAQMTAYRAVPVIDGEGADPKTGTRIMTVATTESSKLEQGPVQTTGRSLDVAIQGDGWLVVQTPEGEAYTRAGNLLINAEGQLATATGKVVLSADDQPIEVNGSQDISFDPHGGINILPRGGRPNEIQRTSQLKLVTPESKDLVRGDDGLFRATDNRGRAQAQPHNPLVKVLGGALEGSNASAAESMVDMIKNARRFEMQMKMIQDASQNAQSANSILSASN